MKRGHAMTDVSVLRVTYDPDNGLALPDNKIAQYVSDVIRFFASNPEMIIPPVVGSESIVQQFRIAVKKGMIPPERCVFIFQGAEISISTNGNLGWWPDGFCSVIDRQLNALTDW